MTTLTLAEAVTRFGVDVRDHLDRQASIPIITGKPQVQGDVIFVPTRRSAKTGSLVPASGIVLVRGEAGGHTHLLLHDGAVTWAPVTSAGADLGVISVPDGAVGYVAHEEHGYLAMGPGDYIARRQRQQADEIRLVAD